MLKTKKILYLVKTMGLGGAERFTIDLAESFTKDFSSVTIASSGGEYESLLKSKGIQHIKLKEDLIISNLIGITKELKKILNSDSYDIVHTQHRILQFAVQLIPGKHFINIYTSNNYFNDFYQTMIFPDMVVAISPLIGRNFKNTSLVNNNRISQINYCTELISNINYRNNDHIIFGFSGRLIKEKGIYIILEAASMLKKEGLSFKIIFRGDGDTQELTKAINKRNLSEEISLLPFTADLNQIYESFDVLLLPSFLNEGLPLTILEAAVRKKLVITGNTGGITDFIKNNRTGILLNDTSPECLYHAMKNVIVGRYNIPEILQAAYELVKKDYSIQEIHHQYLKLYQDSLDN